ncbi:MAG: NUDIX hydrolase [Bifidobacterium sp.]|uniref:NUDIX hydrolase n=1 Tax=Bifidobacterium fermentum TaxID=3059035 RepID=A0AB39UIL1_9BIFI
MITPADFARMLAHEADVAENSAQNIIEADTLLYTSQSMQEQAGYPSGNTPEDDGMDEHGVPTPAIMARRRLIGNLTSFASLDNQDLPVVREYSAGGLIFNEKQEVAIIARHSRSGHLEWCLPKGHIEKGETPEQTAVREVHEETGILGEVQESIATIDYWFTGTNQRIHKLVHHFVLTQTGGFLTVEGDPDHEAEQAAWVSFNDLESVLSYPNERKIVWLYARKLKKQG